LLNSVDASHSFPLGGGKCKF